MFTTFRTLSSRRIAPWALAATAFAMGPVAAQTPAPGAKVSTPAPAAATAPANPNPPSDGSVDKLLGIINARGQMDQIHASMEAQMKQIVAQRMPPAATPQQQKILQDGNERIIKTLAPIWSWDHMQPMLRSIYKSQFSQTEVDAMIAFYTTPAGQAILKKMPQVMNTTMQDVMGKVQALTPQLNEITKDMQLQYSKAEPAPATPPKK